MQSGLGRNRLRKNKEAKSIELTIGDRAPDFTVSVLSDQVGAIDPIARAVR